MGYGILRVFDRKEKNKKGVPVLCLHYSLPYSISFTIVAKRNQKKGAKDNKRKFPRRC
jgi:hypothetical protein